MEIWIRRDGEEYGPYTLEQVKEYVASGELVQEDEAWFDGCEDYLAVGDIPNFTSPPKIARKGPRKQKVTRVEPRKKNPIVIASIVVSSVLLVAGLVVGGFYILKASSAKKKDARVEAPKPVVETSKAIETPKVVVDAPKVVVETPKVVVWDQLEYRDGLDNYFEGVPFTGVGVRNHRNGQKWFEVTYKDGKRDGLATYWHENGQKRVEATYKDGNKHGLYTLWHSNGQKKSEATYKDGKSHGLTTGWYEDGQKQGERTVNDGLLHGLYTRWYENGQKKDETIWKDGKPVSGKRWDEAGNPR